MIYDKYRFIFPPRPKNAIPDTELNFWDNGSLIAQPKLNGSNSTIYTNGKKIIVMNRHGQRLSSVKVEDSEILSLYRGTGGWMILNCEYMNKSKSDENSQVFNHKFVIFDILAYDGEYLVGKTFEERIKLLDELYGQVESEKEYLFSVTQNVYRVKSYSGNFLELYNDLIKIDMYEGLVMKRKNAKLELGTSENNNTKSQIKCRKKCNSYRY
jgi:hypothetical protein